MNFLDAILLAVIGLACLRGLFRGLVKEVLSLAGLVAGFLLAHRFHGLAEPWLERFIASPILVKTASYFLIILVVVLAAALVGRLIKGLLSITLLGWVDHLTGAAFGLAEGVLVAALAAAALHALTPRADYLKESILAPRTLEAAGLILDHAPDTVRDALNSRGLLPGEANRSKTF